MEPYLWKRLWRKPGLSICSLLLGGVLCFLLVYLTGYRQSQQEELLRIKTSYDIQCVITDRKGTKSTSLRADEDAVLFVQDMSENGLGSYIRDLRITKEYQMSAPSLGIEAATLFGITGEDCDDRLNRAKGGSATYDIDDFYSQDGFYCIVSEQMYQQMEDGEKILTLMLMDPYIDSEFYDWYGTGTVDFEVAGHYAGSGNDIFISFSTAQRIADEISSGRRSFDSMTFTAADNEKLEELEKAASKVFGQVDPKMSWPKLAMTIHDEQYQVTSAALEQNIERTRYLLPLVALLGLGVGFLISFLATRGEGRTYALMRTLGLTRGKLFWSVLREQMVLTVLSAVIVALATGKWMPALIYLGCHTVGCCVAVVRSVRVAPTAILREQE